MDINRLRLFGNFVFNDVTIAGSARSSVRSRSSSDVNARDVIARSIFRASSASSVAMFAVAFCDDVFAMRRLKTIPGERSLDAPARRRPNARDDARIARARHRRRPAPRARASSGGTVT
jgi:hypothetical protein